MTSEREVFQVKDWGALLQGRWAGTQNQHTQVRDQLVGSAMWREKKIED